jgi:hypothetical protein
MVLDPRLLKEVGDLIFFSPTICLTKNLTHKVKLPLDRDKKTFLKQTYIDTRTSTHQSELVEGTNYGKAFKYCC